MLNSLLLENFRNHKKLSLNLEKTTVFIGKNGIGKTNVLEAVALLAFGRSFREEDKRNLIHFDFDYTRVKTGELEVYIEKEPRLKMLAKNKGVGRRLADFIGLLPAVVFSPETVDIIIGAPKDRRRFLDILISQTDREYIKALSAYTKTRRQRNRLLQRIAEGEAGESELDFWDAELSEHAKIINQKRGELLVYLSDHLSDLYKEISGKQEKNLEVIYHQKSGDDLQVKLAENRAREIAIGSTIYGPHRDDLEFRLAHKNMANFASRGELRSAILALKISELRYLEEIIKKSKVLEPIVSSPVLLLDDIFSEFDEDRRKHLSKLISEYQTLITTTEKKQLEDNLLKSAKIIEL